VTAEGQLERWREERTQKSGVAMIQHPFRQVLLLVMVSIAFGVSPPEVLGQLLTQHVKGSYGLKTGVQPPPGGYVVAPVFYVYNSDTIKNRDGDRLPITADLNSSFFGTGYSRVTSKKIFGGDYGFTFLFPAGANNRIQGTEIDANPGAGITDSIITPISLGGQTSWLASGSMRPRADTLMAPTTTPVWGCGDSNPFLLRPPISTRTAVTMLRLR
jgi:hypothetical protein